MIWCLDFHAPYRCRHAGACCRAPWTIPFEDGTVAARDAAGACTFLDVTARRCSIHRDGGVGALPLTCRMFPRIVRHDARGTFVSLSHFCPTAAGLLFDAIGEGRLVTAPAALTDIGGAELDGLDARGEWPPLLRPRVMMDADSYAAWEERGVTLIARHTVSPRDALAELEDLTACVTAWTPGSGSLEDVVLDAFERRAPSSVTTAGHAADAAVRRWLAARLFGTWTAYQGDGLASSLRYLRACLDTFDVEVQTDGNAFEAIRRSDLRILHSGASEGPHRRT